MLNIITALGRNGFQDWVLQRVSAVILGLYTFVLLGFWLCMPWFENLSWHNLFNNQTMRLITIIALVSLMIHAWIGMWTIITDYIKTPALSFFIKVFIFLALAFYLFWGIQILWG
jgi:succinate dehydrogenase / fumarate reductase membrane anchor subunit